MHARKRRAARCRAARVKRVDSVFFGDINDREKVAAKTNVHRLGHVERGRGRDRRVDRVSALHQDAQSCLRRKRLAGRHHAIARNNRRATLCQPSFGTIAANGVVRGPG